jgi:ADP-heptose:LPS heptosyltransferase
MDSESRDSIVVPPFFGEFGWELMFHIPYVRKFCHDNSDLHVKVCILENKRANHLFYEDIFENGNASVVFVPYNGRFVSDTLWGYDTEGQRIDETRYCPVGEIALDLEQYTNYDTENGWHHNFDREYLRYKKYGKTSQTEEKIVCFHARNRMDIRPQENWSQENWNVLAKRLYDKGYSAISIGSAKESLLVKGSINLRGTSSRNLVNTVARCQMAFGPSSGAMHLASLCGTPHFVWSLPHNRQRYLKHWNPFDTRCVFCDEYGFQPPVEHVIEKAEVLL